MRQWLKTARIEKGLTMKDMGTKLGITESYYCAIEAGERQKKMDIVLASALSTILGMPIAEVIRCESEHSGACI